MITELDAQVLPWSLFHVSVRAKEDLKPFHSQAKNMILAASFLNFNPIGSCSSISHIVHDNNVRFSESLAVKSESTQRNAFLEGDRHFWIDGKAWSSKANVFQLLTLKIDANWNGGAKLGDTARPIWKAEGLAWTSNFFFDLITTL